MAVPECVKCGKQVAEDNRFCPGCGAAVVLDGPTVTSAPKYREPNVARRSSTSSASVHGRFEPGTKLGKRYRIVGLLGRGGMGEVYRADDLELGQSVALKFLPERVAADPTALDRFRGEVRNARKIAHPNVCRMYDIGEIDGHVFLSMEYIDGEDMAHVLARMGRPSQEKALEIARQLCLALAAAHENGVLHRDLKPANIMIDGRGRVRITDFGLAGLADELAGRRERAGTPAYMAPEQLEDGKVSVRSDIYSLGLVLHEIFTGKRAFDTNDVAELKKLHSSDSVTTPSSGTHPLDPAVERVVERCLEHDSQKRPQSVYAVLGALPGGDPLAAALAAGELPSPDLVANSRDSGGLRPVVASALLVAMALFLAITYRVYVGTTVLPERPSTELAVVAKQIMVELGYEDLQLERLNSVSGYDVNTRLAESARTSTRTIGELAELEWPPRFRYWRRWADGAFVSDTIHDPEYFSYDGFSAGKTVNATVALDSTGRLVGLTVSPSTRPSSSPPSDAVDWTPILRRAELIGMKMKAVSPIKMPPVYCDEFVAWQVKQLGDENNPVTIQVGAFAGQLNYFEIIGLDTNMSRRVIGGGVLTTLVRPSSIRWVLRLLMMILAWRNFRASRGDWRSATRCGLVVATFYALTHLMARFLQSQSIGDQDWRDAGHVILHGIEVFVFYMAMEPYVRRIWPRMLVGVVRLLSGRFRDPTVGRELLVGVVAGCGLVAVLALTSSAEWFTDRVDSGHLPSWRELKSRSSPILFLCVKFHRAAWTIMDTTIIAGLLIAIRLLTRRTMATIPLAMVILGYSTFVWFTTFVGADLVPAMVYASCFSVAIVLLFTKVGILAGMAVIFVVVPERLSITDSNGWFTPYVVAELSILLALAAYGYWVSLAGQPILKDMLAEPQPKT